MIIGIDVGGTNIKSGLMDLDNKLVFDDSRPTGTTQDEIVNNLAEIINELNDKAKSDFGADVLGVGIGVPGVVSKELDHVFKCTNLGWFDVPLREILKEKTSFSVYIDNDANLAALAEHYVGSLQNVDSGILLTLGTGVGGGVIVNNKPFRGGNGLGLEVGHMVIGENFFNCSCGKNGCFETFASATAIVRHFEKMLADNNITVDHEISSKEIFDRAAKGEELPLKAVDRYTTYLAIGINNVINVLDPQVISLGGGVSAAGDFLMDMLTKKVTENLFVKGFPSAKINYASAGNKAGVIGAALLVKEEMTK
ncbi:ROK family glucokinase [Thiospirochaeta perfilievii]|uniref:Glucokinase n=1 Tax=Thiospirochaeta perfilievii TaxID=252967 RepID=A0A5C1QCC8_9SPIO|nr:ROK family glucokinase [Thiospirochaeta perfilievii]QEN05117.1 ROK family glucokinase [Thiospirochaeta perfilievii]